MRYKLVFVRCCTNKSVTGYFVSNRTQCNSRFMSNYMVNILPQARDMNRKGGAWYQTEQITECFREHYPPLTVIGGPIWGPSSRLLESHGVEVPEYFWKVIFHSEDSIAWIIPNNNDAKKQRLDKYLTSITEIENRTGQSSRLAEMKYKASS